MSGRPMTSRQFTAEVRKIWKDACGRVTDLIRRQGFTVFRTEWDLHKYVKHKNADGIVRRGNDLLEMLVNGRSAGRGGLFVVATPEAVAKERRATRKDEIKQLRHNIEQSKNALFRDQAKLAELLSDKKDDEIDYDK